jgi:hypothetical protein
LQGYRDPSPIEREDALMKTKTLKAFTEQVNKLNKEECDALNKENNLFFAGHVPYPESMMEYYFKNGFTPQNVIDSINDDCEQEAAWEARVS